MSNNDQTNPLVYLFMIPAILFSILFSRRNSLKNTFFEANSLKEALLEGVGWAIIQLVAQFIYYSIHGIDIPGVWQMLQTYLIAIGIFIGPLLNYAFNRYRNYKAM